MRNYDFNEKLSWPEFENLACAVIQKRENIQLQTFKAGKDGGIDGLWISGDKKLILQAKRYSNFKSMLSELKGKELKKVKTLNPDRYILVVSLRLHKDQWEQIFNLFGDYIKDSKDFIDGRQLNNLLSQPEYRAVERNFTSLWLPDTTTMQEILDEVIHKKQRTRNLNEYRRTLEISQVFIQTDTYDRALKRLRENHVLIISGEPGMGKTTLARVLALEFLDVRDYHGFVWAENVDEVNSQWEDEQKQVFILDDFWGSVLYRDNQRRTNRKLEELFWRVQNDEQKRLIITSREYIVQQELEASPELRDMIQGLKLKCILRGYSDAEKAMIFFSHLKNSGLEYEYVRELYYMCDKIVYNAGYSPRNIEMFIKRNPCKKFSPKEYAEELLEYMEYPENFWKEIFKELSEFAKIVVSIMAISYTPIRLDDIQLSYGKYIQEYANGMETKSFESCISELENTFIITEFDADMDAIAAEFNNPSILDFMLEYLREH